MKKILTIALAISMIFASSLSAKTETQIKNEEKAKAYKAKQAQKKAEKAAKSGKKSSGKNK